MCFLKLVLFVDKVGSSLAARSRDAMFIIKRTFCGIYFLTCIFRLFEQDMLGADLFFADSLVSWSPRLLVS